MQIAPSVLLGERETAESEDHRFARPAAEVWHSANLHADAVSEVLVRRQDLRYYNLLEDDPFSGMFRGLAAPESPASAVACPGDCPSRLRADC